MSDDLYGHEEPDFDPEFEAFLDAQYDLWLSDQDDPLRELPDDEYCVTCGREWGTGLRSDGRYYCSMCWAVWNR